MDDLKQFLEHQQTLADMSDGDIEEYEARMRLRAKRRKLWKLDEHFASSSQSEREASEFATCLKSLSPSEDVSDELFSEGKSGSQRDNNSPQDTMPGDSNTGYLVKITSNPVRSSPSSRVISAQRETNDAADPKSLRATVPSITKQPPSSSSSVLMPPLDDIPSAPAGGDSDATGHFFPDQNCVPPSGKEIAKVAKNERISLREKNLRKRKAPDSEEPNISTVSNVTSPSNSPTISSLSYQGPNALQLGPTLESNRIKKKAKGAQKAEEAAIRKKEEEEEKKMTPREYAVRVQSKFVAYLEKASLKKLTLRDKAIFYIGGDYHTASQGTRKKMDHLRKKGATVVPLYDPNIVTHIITEGNATVTLKALGLKSLDEIPMHIPTLTWSWVTEGKPDSPEFWFAAFPSRIDASTDKTPEPLKARRLGKLSSLRRPVGSTDEEFSRIEDFTVAEHMLPDDSAHASTSKAQVAPVSTERAADDDPLAEFYAQARKDVEAENELLQLNGHDSDDNGSTSTGKGRKFTFTCDQQRVGKAKCMNQDIVDKLSQLEEINKTKVSGDPNEQRWRVFSYGKCTYLSSNAIRAIKAHPKRIRNYEDAISIKGIGQKTAQKIVEIIQTGDLGRIKYDNTEDVQTIKLFYNIYGVGLGTAQKWYMMGCRTLEDVRNRKGGIKVSDVQEIGLKYYDDINTRIPRSEVAEIFITIKTIALGIDPKLSFQVMGSYRRGKDTCGDIDILMTRPTDDGRTHQGVLLLLLKELHLRGILTEDLAVPDDFQDLEQTYRGLCRRDEKSPRRRIDILAVPYHERGGALIYYTGDDIFNRAIRYKAKKMGYSLSQHGLSAKVLRDERGKKLVQGELIASETEEEIFRILGVPWQEPHERVRA